MNKDNTRKFPGERGPRPDLASLKRKEAKERQAEYDKLSTQERLARLDAIFGVGKGASNERAQLLTKLPGAKEHDQSIGLMTEEVQVSEDKPRVKAKDRRKNESKKD